MSSLLSVLTTTSQSAQLRTPEDAHTRGQAARGCRGLALPTCSMEIGVSQHCRKLDTPDRNLCFFECVPQEWRWLNLGTEVFPAVPGEPVPESCGVRRAVCLKASVAGWELELVLRNSGSVDLPVV